MKINFESEVTDRNAVVLKKVEEVASRFQPGDRKWFNDLCKTLDWYMSARMLKKQEPELDKHSQGVLQNQIGAIESNGQDFETLDKEFSIFSDEEIILIRQKLFRF